MAVAERRVGFRWNKHFDERHRCGFQRRAGPDITPPGSRARHSRQRAAHERHVDGELRTKGPFPTL